MTISVNQLEEARRALDAPLYADVGGDVDVSFEFSPPKTDKAEENLWQSIEALRPLSPRFLSVTYGAGGSTRDRTHATVARIARDTDVPAAAHLTCVEATRAEIDAVADAYWQAGVRHIVALRGDPPAGASDYAPHPGGYENAAALVAGLQRLHPFEISVAGYPECHPSSTDRAADLDNLKRKLDAGATRAITQFFFEPETFFRFRDACEKAGIDGSKLTPGILPIENWKGARNFARRCGTKIPAWVEDAFEKALRDDRADLLATAMCSELCTELLEGGVEKLHFYTLNRPELTRDVCFALGITPKVSLENVA